MSYYESYSYEVPNTNGDAVAVTILMIYLVILLVWGIISLGGYILKGIGMYTIAKRQGMEYPWLAYVPFARAYLQGELGGEIALKEKKIQNPGIWLLALPFIHGAIFFIFYIVLWVVGMGAMFSMTNYYNGPGVGTVIALIVVGGVFLVFNLVYRGIYKVLQVLVDHQILERFTSKNMSIVHGVLSALIPLYEPICFFVMRNKLFCPGMEPDIPSFTYEIPTGTVPGTETAPEEAEKKENGFVPQRGLMQNASEDTEKKEELPEDKTE